MFFLFISIGVICMKKKTHTPLKFDTFLSISSLSLPLFLFVRQTQCRYEQKLIMSLLFAFRFWNLFTHTKYNSALWTSIAYSKTDKNTWKRKLNFPKKTKNDEKYWFYRQVNNFFFHFDFFFIWPFSLFDFFNCFFRLYSLSFYGRFLSLYLLNFAQCFFSPFQPLAQQKNLNCESRRKNVHFSWHWIQPFVIIIIIRHASHKKSQNANENIFRCFKC